MDNIIGGGEVESRPSSLQADEKNIALAVLKIVDPLLPLFDRGRSVQILIADLLLIQQLANDPKVVDKLTKDEDLVIIIEKVI